MSSYFVWVICICIESKANWITHDICYHKANGIAWLQLWFLKTLSETKIFKFKTQACMYKGRKKKGSGKIMIIKPMKIKPNST